MIYLCTLIFAFTTCYAQNNQNPFSFCRIPLGITLEELNSITRHHSDLILLNKNKEIINGKLSFAKTIGNVSICHVNSYAYNNDTCIDLRFEFIDSILYSIFAEGSCFDDSSLFYKDIYAFLGQGYDILGFYGDETTTYKRWYNYYYDLTIRDSMPYFPAIALIDIRRKLQADRVLDQFNDNFYDVINLMDISNE
jgi:hypothetical protein